jgi:hypothetical protein
MWFMSLEANSAATCWGDGSVTSNEEAWEKGRKNGRLKGREKYVTDARAGAEDDEGAGGCHDGGICMMLMVL